MSQQKQISVALIEDHDLLRNGLSEFLEKLGIHVSMMAKNGQIALEQMQQAESLPDVCITDVNMPVLDGFGTAKAIRAQFPELKVLGYSMNNEAEVIVEMLRCGANGYIVKGGSIEELKEGIEKVHKEGVYFGQSTGKVLLEYLRKRKGN